MTIVCYGDSNTRFYLGDKQESGALELSYPHFLQQIFTENGKKDVTVYNCGYPDMQTDYGVEHFEENVSEKYADICIFGFGTNNIRQPDFNLDKYISEMEMLFKKCEKANIKAYSLLIPWFSEGYCGADGQKRIPLWNAALITLCGKYNVKTIDTYTAFVSRPDKYFNEKTSPQRHYSPAATAKIAQMAYEVVVNG